MNSKLDRIFEQGLSDVTRAPQKTLSEEQLKAVAAASKSGAGIWLLLHAKDILIGVVSFVMGCLVTFAVLHYIAPKPSEPQAREDVNVDTLALPAESETVIVEMFHETSLQNNDHSIPSSVNPTSNITRHTSRFQTPKSQVQSPKSQDPVIVKKNIVKRDTVRIHETVIVKDTIVIEN